MKKKKSNITIPGYFELDLQDNFTISLDGFSLEIICDTLREQIILVSQNEAFEEHKDDIIAVYEWIINCIEDQATSRSDS